MLQSTPFSKVYGHGHIKKLWLMQNQKETENKALLASSTSRNTANSSGLGHESKQGTQFSVGNTSTRLLTTPSGLPVRPLVSGPACFNMAMARQTSLVTCAESLSPSACMEQSRSLAMPSSPCSSASMLKKENCCLDTDAEQTTYHDDASSASTSRWGFSYGKENQVLGEHSSPITLKAGGFDGPHKLSSSINASRHDNTDLQGFCQNGKLPHDASIKIDNTRFSKCSLGFFGKLEAATPFAVPFQLPEKYFLEAGAKLYNAEAANKADRASGNLCTDNGALPSISNSERGRTSLFATFEGKHDKGDGGLGLRTCSVCGTAKTPLWRSGPQGPKSLCNACGIRFKKAKRGSNEGIVRCENTSGRTSPKAPLKPVKRKQSTPSVNGDPSLAKSRVANALSTQVVKKRRWSQLTIPGDLVNRNVEVTGSSNESSLTWNLHSPSAVSSPSVSHFERLSIAENPTAPDVATGKVEEEAAALLMYMSWGFVFA